MSKRKQNTAIDQVMNELNEEITPSFHTSPNLFSPDLLSEPAKIDKTQDSVVRVGTAVSTEPIRPEKSPSPSPSIDEPSSPEELSELENLLSFEPNRNKYQEELEKESVAPQAKEESAVPAEKKSRAQRDPKEVELVKNNKKNLMQGAIGKMANFYNHTVDPGISISLKQSENLRVAQERIIALEEEIDRLRKENEELISAGDIFRERMDKMAVQNDNLKKSYEESREEFQEEKKTLMDTLNDQSREMDKMVLKNKELEKRLSNNIQQIRVRERELENRLELMKLDSQTLVREKDQYILDLKRQIDRTKMDIETQKNRYTETEQKLTEQKSQTRRAARGLQMALHILRGNDFSIENKE